MFLQSYITMLFCRYERVYPEEICCFDDTEDRVIVGVGDSCCGTIPYSSDGAQVCCNGG